MPRTGLRTLVHLLSFVVLVVGAGTAGADPKPLTKEEQAKVDEAIEKGVGFLKRHQLSAGDWPWKMYKDLYLVGQCALPAYALLEAGVPVDDPVIQKAAEYLRPRVLANDKTYELSLAILFFDRLGDPKDKKLIKTLALRLIAGQRYSGGWAYRCPISDEKTEQDLLGGLEFLSKEIGGNKKTREQVLAGITVPLGLQPLTAFQMDVPRGEPVASGTATAEWAGQLSLSSRTDNSNTQFAILGLWAAQRHGIPMEPSLNILVRRFERSQAYSTGAWWYSLDDQQGHHSPSMVCVGLKALAIGRGLKLRTPGSPTGSEKDVHVLKGFEALRRRIGQPSGRMDKPKSLPDYYFLWSVERVAMLYDLPSIGDRDWYRWGAEALVTNQARNGVWITSASTHTDWNKNGPINYKATINTSFALLFLKRSHPMKDLTPKLPVTGEKLNEAVASLRAGDKFPLHTSIAASQSKNTERSVPSPGESKKR